MARAHRLEGAAIEVHGAAWPVVGALVLGLSTSAVAQDRADRLLPPPGYGCDKHSGRGEPIDLADARVAFEDEFDQPSVGAADGSGPWYAPVHGGYGGARFLPPGRDGPFHTNGGLLTIRMDRRPQGWVSGLMQTVNPAGVGFAQRFGYFEMRARFDKGPGVWPAFWLKTVNEFTDRSAARGELDVVEAYGGSDVRGHHASVHVWPAVHRLADDPIVRRLSFSCYVRLTTDMFDGQFHTYGAEVGPEAITIYFDRQRIARYPTLPQFRQPLFVLVSLALLSKEKRPDDAPAEMTVDYVRVWQRAAWETPKVR